MKSEKVKIHWIQVCSYPVCDRIDAHCHEFFHYIYIIQGTGQMELNGNRYVMKPKHMYLTAPGKFHAFQNTGAEKLVTCELKFDFFNRLMTDKMAKLPECVDVADTPILGILQNIRRENANRRAFASDIISMNIQEIYLHLQRASGREQSPANRDDLADVVEYIENNLDCDMNLQDLANIVCLEKTYFLKKFKQLTGLTPMAYTRNARIKKAKELLRYSDMNVTQIARVVGFRSVHHFSRYFAGVVGMSPSRYKESQRLE